MCFFYSRIINILIFLYDLVNTLELFLFIAWCEYMNRSRFILALIVCGLSSLFYMYEFSLQVAPSVISSELMRDFGIDAIGIGFISSIFYYSYTPVQIFGGVSYDYYGPRKVLTIAILICALGALVFARAHSLSTLLLGRFLMGIGSACSYTGALLLISRWFPQRFFAPFSAVVQLMCSIGAIMGQVPLAYMIDSLGWQSSITYFAVVGFVLAALIYLVVRDFPYWRKDNETNQNEIKHNPFLGLKEVLNNSQTWYLGLYSFLSWAPMVVFSALWGVSYIRESFGVTTSQASEAMAITWIGQGVACIMIGWLSERFKLRNIFLISVEVLGLIGILAILYLPGLTFHLSFILLFLVGVSASGQALSFAVVNDINKEERIGTAIGFNNMSVVIGGALLQPLASYLINFFWDGAVVNHIHFYSVQAYKYSMSILPVCCILAIVVAKFFIRETYCQEIHPKTQYH